MNLLPSVSVKNIIVIYGQLNAAEITLLGIEMAIDSERTVNKIYYPR